jgi:enoyl-CoA hydratase
MPQTLSLQVADHVAQVTLTGTTMPPAFFEELGPLFRQLAADPQVRVVVLSGAGKAFCHGLDLPAAFGELGPHLTEGGLAGARSELLTLIRRWQEHLDLVARCPVPVIAAIHGWCIGGGLDLVSACDIRLATRDARFSLRETKVAIVADLGSLQRLPHLIGQGALREMAFTGGNLGAERALALGLVNQLFDDREALLKGALEMAREIAANPPLTVRGVKEVLNQPINAPVKAGLDYVSAWNAAFLASEDLLEAFVAFMEGRAPTFKGR